ncbi:ABC transporter ATP-binding protein [Mangrovibrevibacter kandeliae]|uniref:ABC transporter ATP-binding protein n=1 Tax=Mangrovibrevibacter kandeliae TaxID=2968473 RepID=UPI0021191CF1|nr:MULTISPECIES: ABC transporter ATP-binding protein [unclassified Aurantimonas]MCQ8781888.1 ABC transporter ATP-binding protein [Aurantimonas sp. CSK15Z-1]MCW4115454.1 ABC transporter ATP-binding protein [Aurantimonas sp. MSK8Z-1]
MLTLQNLTKVYPARPGEFAGGIREANIDLASGTFFTLLGPSGCGKTTTLRCIAGLETPDSGRIIVGGTPLYDREAGIDIPLHRRNIGMVFQSYAIWPHMTVFDNVAFPLRVSKERRYSGAEIKAAVGEALEIVGLASYARRSATQLSGGQQQRVALARAVVHRPKLLLLDEPLSNLDAALREEMRLELKRLQRELGITAVYVTHDQSEALAMSDVIAVIAKGRMVQVGAPRDIYFSPVNEFVAGFVGHTNILRGRVSGEGAGPCRPVSLEGGGEIRCRALNGVGPDVAVSIRPEDITLQDGAASTGAGDGAHNVLNGKVTAASFLGNVVHYEIQPTGSSQVFRVEAAPATPFDLGSPVVMRFPPEAALAVART